MDARSGEMIVTVRNLNSKEKDSTGAKKISYYGQQGL